MRAARLSRYVSLGLACLLPHIAAAALQVSVLSPQVELGKPVWVTLHSNQTKVSLDTLDIRPWQRDFVLARERELVLADDNRSQRLRLQLFPLHQGQFELPALSFLTQHSSAIAIEVSAARDAKTQAPIDFACKLPSLRPWQQQAVNVACTITTANAYAVFNLPRDNVNGVQLLPMQQQQYAVHETLEAQTRYQLGWVLLPEHAGEVQVQLPPIQYVRDGVVTHQFYVPPLALQVQALPAWLPGTIPVGRVSVDAYRLTQAWLSTSVLSRLQLRLQLTGVAPPLIPDYPQQLHSDRAMQFYAPQRQLHTRIDSHGLQHQLMYDIPVVARQLGRYRLPDLRVQYFDPDSGTLKTRVIHGQSVLVLNGAVKVLVLLMLAVALAWAAHRLGRWLLRYWRRAQTYRLALQQLTQPASLPTIRAVMQTMARAEGWSMNLSYLQWQRRMQAVTPLASQLAVQRLNAASYARQEIALTAVVQVLTRLCRTRRFALR
jgi:hypothetical protein